ncbi:MAG: hypothetical protein HRT44_06070 [Bdellovibrionales bacterium]|nr:hypothetical protein [Bdellovibrionales bacterium]NQZ18809.1 hypothetical protein [Bdellovibrionales bacterium]
MRRLLFTLSFLALISCSVPEDISPQDSIEELSEYDSDNVSVSSTEVNGTGRFVSESYFKSTRTNAHFVVSGNFFDESSSLTLHLFFDSFEHDTGIQLRFTQSTENPESLVVEFAEPSRPYRILSTIAKAIASDSSFSIRIETLNAMNNSRRLIIWNDSVFYETGTREPKDILVANNAEYDSQRLNHVFYYWGAGIRWGVNLKNFRLTELRREAPYVAP